MYKRLSSVMFPIVAVLLIGALVWGYQENQEKNAILIKAENQYQRAFHDLSFHMDKLHSEIGNTLAVHTSSLGMHRKGLMNVWRLTSEAQNEISQLPLTMLPFHETDDFLSRISNFAYKASMRDLTNEPLSQKELGNLKQLYQNSSEITKNLKEVQQKVLSDRLRWMDAETAMAAQGKVNDNTIVDGFRSVNQKVQQYPELDWGPSVSNMYTKRTVKKLDGIPMTKEQIQNKAAKFSNQSVGNIQVQENGKGTEWESFTASVGQAKDSKLMMDFTRNGGMLISYSDTRQIGTKKVSRNEVMAKADQFLSDKGYKDMKAVNYDEYGNLANLTYVRKQGDTLIYPEKISVRAGLDTGEVTGFQASDFVNEHKDQRNIPKARLTAEQARKKLNPDFEESYVRKSLIENEFSKEVLCYEFGGRINGTRYRIYINADTGMEEAVEEIKPVNATS
ncbi:spore germination protein [Paenibacillus amylolyticus]|uniref:Spore germination protein n=1 Tax=Paenibacillus amylolyticus TaxID=1451 RepID=A0AAP5GXH7_PAEAM|nr:germination protein YpeB [Paenibacillus amylolyticus]MDR6722172.1 spore germination protein [Paenibacillus amylolyticus]